MQYPNESLDRMEKIRQLKEAGVIAYANNYRGKQDIKKLKSEDWKSKIKELDNLLESWIQSDFQIAGRILSNKSHGKLMFSRIADHTDEIQICFMKDIVGFHTGKEVVENLIVEGEEKGAYKIAEKYVHVGDFVWVKGDLFFTKHGELTLLVKEFQILAKAIRPLPEKWHGVTDQETLYRQRYLDMIVNQDTYDRMLLRSKFLKVLRDFYEKNTFIEIETPVLWNSASGAAAAPFITHHNDFDEDFFLRISPETALKKATVGRFERVVEFARDFRNEGSDPSHMQEFTVIEHYAAWWNFEDNMKFTEDMFDYLFKQIPELKKEVEVKDKEGNTRMVNFQTPWQRIDYIAGVKEKSGIDVSLYGPADEVQLREEIKKAGYTWEGIDKQVTATMIDYLYKKVLRPWIVWPAFVYNYPKTMQPLARQNDANPEIVEQWQLVVNGWEVIKAYSELVDPQVQKANFDAQADALEKGDAEATSSDDDFVLAMEYGMPPQSGWGMGIERILCLLTGQDNLRDMVLFPLMKSEGKKEEMKKNTSTKIATVLLNKSANLASWQQMNTVAHLAASFAARTGKNLFMQDTVETQDWESMKLNIQHAIMIKEAPSNEELKKVIWEARKSNLIAVEFTREMLQTSDDKKVRETTAGKQYEDIEILWILLFGERKQVESFTKEFELTK
jgi:lysyl-tRNA synthetase, class II